MVCLAGPQTEVACEPTVPVLATENTIHIEWYKYSVAKKKKIIINKNKNKIK